MKTISTSLAGNPSHSPIGSLLGFCEATFQVLIRTFTRESSIYGLQESANSFRRVSLAFLSAEKEPHPLIAPFDPREYARPSLM